MIGRGRIAAVLVLVGCQPRTELVLGVATDLTAPGMLDEVRLDMSRAGTGVPQETVSWPIGPNQSFNLPGSFGIYTDGETLPVEIVLTGLKGGSPIVTRTARMTLVEGQTVFYRMGLTGMCVNKSMCPTNTDCIEGTCQPIEIPQERLPAFDDELVTHVTCQSAATYLDTATGTPMQMLQGRGACPAGQCAEGTCLEPVADPCNCPSGTTCVNNVCVGEGALRVTLKWSVATDIDLHVLTPNGNEINFTNDMADSGTLDVDDMGDGVHVENVFFTAPPAGAYQVWAVNYSGMIAAEFSIEVVTPAGAVGAFPVTGSLPAMQVESMHYNFNYSGGGP